MDNVLQCPFEPSHRVKVTKFVKHVNKCAETHPNVTFIHCPYDYSHIIKPKDREEHLETCPAFQPDFVLKTLPNIKKLSELYESSRHADQDSYDESWEDDAQYNSDKEVEGKVTDWMSASGLIDDTEDNSSPENEFKALRMNGSKEEVRYSGKVDRLALASDTKTKRRLPVNYIRSTPVSEKFVDDNSKSGSVLDNEGKKVASDIRPLGIINRIAILRELRDKEKNKEKVEGQKSETKLQNNFCNDGTKFKRGSVGQGIESEGSLRVFSKNGNIDVSHITSHESISNGETTQNNNTPFGSSKPPPPISINGVHTMSTASSLSDAEDLTNHKTNIATFERSVEPLRKRDFLLNESCSNSGKDATQQVAGNFKGSCKKFGHESIAQKYDDLPPAKSLDKACQTEFLPCPDCKCHSKRFF